MHTTASRVFSLSIPATEGSATTHRCVAALETQLIKNVSCSRTSYPLRPRPDRSGLDSPLQAVPKSRERGSMARPSAYISGHLQAHRFTSLHCSQLNLLCIRCESPAACWLNIASKAPVSAAVAVADVACVILHLHTMTFTVSSIQAGGSFVHNGAGRLEVAPRAPLFGKVGRRLYLLRVRRAPGFISIRAKGASREKETTSNLIEISYAGDPDFDWSPRSDNKNSTIQGLTAFLTIPEISYAGDPDFDWSPRSDKKSSEFTGISSIKPRVIVIAGPTAVGKTRLSIELAKTLGGEIINADSVQVYQGLDVGAAKISVEEREGIPHHLLDMAPPTVEYTYEQFYVDARAATDQILAKGLVPIVVGGTGMYMRWYMHSIQGITSHPFDGEDVTGEFDDCSSGSADWDFDFQCYFLYQHRADLFQRVDIRCEQMVPVLLEETSWLLGTGVKPDSSAAARAIGYEEAMALLLRARENEGIITEKEFLDFLTDFRSNSKDLVRKQIKWFRNPKRSEVRLFRWTDATKPVDEMVRAIMSEYKRPLGQPTKLADGEIVRAASLKEQKRLKGYRPTLKIFSCPEARYRILEWVRRTQGRLICRAS